MYEKLYSEINGKSFQKLFYRSTKLIKMIRVISYRSNTFYIFKEINKKYLAKLHVGSS